MNRPHLHVAFASRVARLVGCAIVAFIAFSASPSAGRSPMSRFDALPRPSERLAQPIWVPHCGMNIVEWRVTGPLRAETTPSSEALAVIDDVCRDAFRQYGDFLRVKKLPRLHLHPDPLPAISLLPGNTLLDGKSMRALNDLPARFEAVAPACCYWGLYVDSLNHLFLRNDPLTKNDLGALVPNPRFVRTLTHEIGHVLSSRLGVWDAVGYDRQRDEELAEAFVAFVGMHFPAESSAEDLAFHQGHMTPIPPPAADATATDVHVKPPEVPPQGSSANTSPQR